MGVFIKRYTRMGGIYSGPRPSLCVHCIRANSFLLLLKTSTHKTHIHKRIKHAYKNT
jgi:hypothetical protein